MLAWDEMCRLRRSEHAIHLLFIVISPWRKTPSLWGEFCFHPISPLVYSNYSVDLHIAGTADTTVADGAQRAWQDNQQGPNNSISSVPMIIHVNPGPRSRAAPCLLWMFGCSVEVVPAGSQHRRTLVYLYNILIRPLPFIN